MEVIGQTSVSQGPEHSLRISLGDPGMTALHRAGLGGLWLTLEALEQEPEHQYLREQLLALGGAWDKDEHSVTFSWQGDGRAFFQRLIAESFRVTNDGRVWFLGLGHPDNHGDHGVLLQNGLLSTFLQHGKTRGRATETSVTLEIDGTQSILTYPAISRYAHQSATFAPERFQAISGWQFPGGTVRHTQFTGATSYQEAPGAWLSLLYAPVGAIYFQIRRRSRSIRHHACLVFPDVADLPTFSRARRRFIGTRLGDLVVSGTVDAAVRVMAELQLQAVLRPLGRARCLAASFGVVPWSSRQKTRIDLFEVRPLGEKQLKIARIALALLPAVVIRTSGRADNDSEVRWEVSPVSDLLARNLVESRPWWEGFSHLEQNVDLRTQLIVYERSLRVTRGTTGLAALVAEQGVFDDMNGAEVIVRACHEAWRRRQGALGEEARTRGVRFEDLVDRERERLRIAFRNSRNADTLRAVLTDFWSRAGPNTILQDDWREVLPYLSEERWQQARDLALLALASYSSQGQATTN